MLIFKKDYQYDSLFLFRIYRLGHIFYLKNLIQH